QEAQACQGSVKSHRKGSLPPPTLTPLPGAGGEGPPLISLSFMPRPPDSLEATRPVLAAIGALEPELARAGDQELRDKAGALRRQAREGALLETLLPECFALVREIARRVLGERPYDVQMLAGIALSRGKLVEMQTGEGKTLAAVAPVALNALTGRGVHVLT